MSSFVGHSLLGWTIGITAAPANSLLNRHRILWAGWLVIVAVAPDFDYVVPLLNSSAHEGVRITHSLFFASLLPLLTLLCLQRLNLSEAQLMRAGLQLILAGSSHICLDLLVGVATLPVAWPVSTHAFKLPFGLLPSAGKLRLDNYFFYRNLAIEMGVLLPLSASWILRQSGRWYRERQVCIGLLMLISVYFMHWAYGLSR
ncbi:MAG: metal-dependent hydrolase [Cyanobacteria bacterium P01_D01_bin.14]